MLSPELAERLARDVVKGIDARFEARRPKGGEMPVVMGAGASGILLHEAMGHAFEADFNRKGQSIFSDRIGRRICRQGISIVDDVTNMIRLRVANAEEEFINRNLRDKENIETIMKDTADRVQAAKASNDNDYSEEVEESVTKEARDKIYRVQHEGRRNVFGRMVLNLGELAMTKEPLKKEFVLENGRLNLDKVVETVRCIYTVLETVSSLNLEKIDEEYIKETLESMNA